MDEQNEEKKIGRPSIYTPELAAEICRRLSLGETLRAICREDAFPNITTVMDWNLHDKEGFSKQYARARAAQAEHLFDELLEIADDGTNDWVEKKGDTPGYDFNGEHYQRSRLRVDTRKWYLSKVLPKKYGDKLDLTTAGKELPAPILGPLVKNVSDNVEHKEDSDTE